MKITNFILYICILAIFSLTAGCGGGGGGRNETVNVRKILENVNFPAAIAPCSENEIYYSELATGQIKVIINGAVLNEPAFIIPAIPDFGFGILGLTCDIKNKTLYAYYSTKKGNMISNQVSKLSLVNNKVTSEKILISGIPAGGHNGGKMTLDQNNTLYITTGDATDPNLSANSSSLAGKILTISGGVLSIFAKGIRNSFGITATNLQNSDGSPLIIFTENGPDCDDRILKLAAFDYGWPSRMCGSSSSLGELLIDNFTDTLGLTGVAYQDRNGGEILVGDYNTGAIRRYTLDNSTPPETLFTGDYGPILDIQSDNSHKSYFSTSTDIYILE